MRNIFEIIDSLWQRPTRSSVTHRLIPHYRAREWHKRMGKYGDGVAFIHNEISNQLSAVVLSCDGSKRNAVYDAEPPQHFIDQLIRAEWLMPTTLDFHEIEIQNALGTRSELPEDFPPISICKEAQWYKIISKSQW